MPEEVSDTEIPTITCEQARGLYWDGPGESEGDWAYVAVQFGEPRRWSRTGLMILRHEPTGKHYGLQFDQGLTENQDDEFPWDKHYFKPFEPDRALTPVPVYAKQIMVTKYSTKPISD